MKHDYHVVKRIFKITDSNWGNTEFEISEKEKVLGSNLPEELKSFYLIFGKNEIIQSAINQFIQLKKLEIDDEGRLLIFYDNQTTHCLFFEIDELLKGKAILHGQTLLDKTWKFKTQEIFSTIRSKCLQAALCSIDFRAFKFGVNEKELEKIGLSFKQLGKYSKFTNTTFFQNNPNQLIGVNISEGTILVSIASKNQHDFDLMLKKINIDWQFLIEKGVVKIQKIG